MSYDQIARNSNYQFGHQAQPQRTNPYYDNSGRSYPFHGESARPAGGANRPIMVNPQQQQQQMIYATNNVRMPSHVQQPLMGSLNAGVGGGVAASNAPIQPQTGSQGPHSQGLVYSTTTNQPLHQYQQHHMHQQQHPQHPHAHQHPHQHSHQHQQLHAQSQTQAQQHTQQAHQHHQQPHSYTHSHQSFASTQTQPSSTTTNVHVTAKPNVSSTSVQTGPSSSTVQGSAQIHPSSSGLAVGGISSQGIPTQTFNTGVGSNQGAASNLSGNNTTNLSSNQALSSTASHAGVSGGASGNVSSDSRQAESKTQTKQQEKGPKHVAFTAQELSWRGTPYEVKCDETFAVYPAFVVDYLPSEQKAVVLYENGWKPLGQVSLEYIRPIPLETDYNTWRPVEGDRVEVKAKAEESEPYGWWAATVVTVKDNLYMIRFEGWGANHDQILDLEMLRPFPVTEPFSPTDWVRVVEKIPQEMVPYCKVRNAKCKFADDFKLIRERAGLFHLGLGPRCEDIIIVGTKKKCMIARQLLKYLWKLEMQSTEDEKQLIQDEKKAREEYEMLKNCYKIKFKFDEKFTKHVIGKNRCYVSKAEKMPGVKHVSVTDGYCAIFADSHEAAADARQLLELSLDTIDIPSVCRRDLIGKDGENITKLQNNLQVMLISTWEHYCKSAKIHYDPTDIPENKLRMVIFGPKEHVAQAKAVIEDEVRIILQRLEYDRRDKEADRELRQWSYTQKDEETKNSHKEGGNRGNTRKQGSRDDQNTSGGMENSSKRRRGGDQSNNRGKGSSRNTGRGNANREQYEENKNETYEEKTDQRDENENNDQYNNEENAEFNEDTYNAEADFDYQHDQEWNDDAEHGDYYGNEDVDPDTMGYDDYDGYDNYGDEQGFVDYEYGYDDEAQGDEERPRGGGGRRGQRQNRRERKPQYVYVQKGTKSQDPNATQSNQ